MKINITINSIRRAVELSQKVQNLNLKNYTLKELCLSAELTDNSNTRIDMLLYACFNIARSLNDEVGIFNSSFLELETRGHLDTLETKGYIEKYTGMLYDFKITTKGLDRINENK